TKRSVEIVRILKDLSREEGLTVIMVSHNPELARMADRQFEMRDGEISERENLNWNMSERHGPERVPHYVAAE
ncbi:MAG TPA: hypothetical protein VFK23_09335, partial [Nitrospirota bacterium]|nr:hypothetical protein [Nitrospirota bacterium]